MVDRTATAESGLRGALLLVVALGSVGLIVELLLLEHLEEWTQWIPLVVLGVCLALCVLLAVRPRAALVRLFRWFMGVTIATGVIGVWLHFAGNRAFEMEMDASRHGWLLVWQSLRGATPALAPGAMVQLGLTGMLFTWRHPALTPVTDDQELVR